MKQSIQDLWIGNIAPSETCGVGDPQIERLIIMMERNKDDLIQTLHDQQKEILNKYTACTDEYTYLITMQSFVEGFCLAAKLFTEALSD